MTKKIILMIVLGISVLSIIVISVWGTLPESINDSSVTSISFENFEYNDDGDKVINVRGIITEEDTLYTLTYVYLPEDAATNITATSSSDDVSVIVDEYRQEVVVNFDTVDSIGKNVTITIVDSKTNESDEVTLIFKIDVIIVD